MSSPFRASLIALGLAALALSACDREERHSRSKPIGETVPAGESPDTIWPGGTEPPALDPRAHLFDNNAPAISQGQTLFSQMNCSGCPRHGGGGMRPGPDGAQWGRGGGRGPALIDAEWRYGGRIDQIAASIAEGRPNGMPSWRTKLTQDQIWQL